MYTVPKSQGSPGGHGVGRPGQVDRLRSIRRTFRLTLPAPDEKSAVRVEKLDTQGSRRSTGLLCTNGSLYAMVNEFPVNKFGDHQPGGLELTSTGTAVGSIASNYCARSMEKGSTASISCSLGPTAGQSITPTATFPSCPRTWKRTKLRPPSPNFGVDPDRGRVRLFSATICVSWESGGKARNRTGDTRIFSPLLYQLSYLAADVRAK